MLLEDQNTTTGQNADSVAATLDELYALSPFLRPKDVARLLGCHPKLVYSLVREGRLLSVALGSTALRIPRASVISFVEAQLIPEQVHEVEDRP